MSAKNKELITVVRQKDGLFKVLYENGVEIGDVLQDVDGFFYYWPVENGGSWSSHVMRAIADKLDELNKPWQDKIDATLDVPRL